MCGIAGYIGKNPLAEERIHATLPLMKQRGPDAQQFVTFIGPSIHVALLHSRLGIVDLDARSNQPMTIGDVTVVLNGEIYNYVELREKLLKKGIQLKTTSDTEVLLHYYILYGSDCVTHFEGMWSFVLYDKSTQKTFICRDRFAEKPLWIYETSDAIYFASETRFLKTLSNKSFEINTNHLLRYLVNGHKSLYKTDETYYSEIREFPPATHWTIDYQMKKSSS